MRRAFFLLFFIDKLVKSHNLRWLSKKLYMRGAYILNYFGVLEYVVMIKNLQQRSR